MKPGSNTIQALQNSRVGPVELMSTLGNIVNKTSDIYLYTLSPQGERFELKGQSNSVDSMANFIAYLKTAGPFDDVQLSQFYQDDVKDKQTYKFSVSCGFKSGQWRSIPDFRCNPRYGRPRRTGELWPKRTQWAQRSACPARHAAWWAPLLRCSRA